MSNDRKNIKELQKRAAEAHKKASQRVRSVQYQNDTVRVNYKNYQTDAYFETSTGRLVNNIKYGYKSDAKTRIDMAHEAKHASNAHFGIPEVSAEQFYKLRALDEISARITGILAWREDYLKAENKKEFLANIQKMSLSDPSNPDIPFDYFNALVNGKINPESNDPKEFDREMELIAKETFANYAGKLSGYEKEFSIATRGYMNIPNHNFQENNAEYERFAKHYMTISGIDFRKYLDSNYEQQFYIPSQIKNASKDLAAANDADRAQIIADAGLTYDGKISLEQYHILLQHQKIVKSIKYNIDDKFKSSLCNGEYDDIIGNPVEDLYDTFKKRTSHRNMDGSNDMEYFINSCMDLALTNANGKEAADDAEFERRLKEIYTLDGTDIDLRQYISNFSSSDIPYRENAKLQEFLKDPEKYKADHPYKKRFDLILEYHEGEPDWAEATADQRVSEIKSMDIFDAEGDFLKAEREQRELEQEIERLKKEEELKKVEPLYDKKYEVYYLISEDMAIKGNKPQFNNAEIRSTINDDTGEITQVAMLDGQKHGAEITRDKDGNITGYKVYDHGKEIDAANVKLDIREENGMEYICPQINGQKFGAEIVTDINGKTKAAFYEQNGMMIEASLQASIEKTENHISADKDYCKTQVLTDRQNATAQAQKIEDDLQNGSLIFATTPHTKNFEESMRGQIIKNSQDAYSQPDDEQTPTPLRPQENSKAKTPLPYKADWQKDNIR